MKWTKAHGRRFQAVRVQKGFKTFKSLADAAGVNYETISKIESGTNCPNSRTFRGIASAFRMSEDALWSHLNERDADHNFTMGTFSFAHLPRYVMVNTSKPLAVQQIVLSLDSCLAHGLFTPLEAQAARQLLGVIRST